MASQNTFFFPELQALDPKAILAKNQREKNEVLKAVQLSVAQLAYVPYIAGQFSHKQGRE